MKRFGVRYELSLLVTLVGVTMATHRAAADAPAGRYVQSSGTVLDTKTGLTWQQKVPAADTWSNAGTYCASNTPMLPGSGWRLPSVKELLSLVDDSRKGPAIDPVAFPGTLNAFFWSSSPLVVDPGTVWQVDFTNGASGGVSATGDPQVFRCVR